MTDRITAARALELARFDLEQPETHMGSASMYPQPGYGDWVKHEDAAAALADMIHRAEADRMIADSVAAERERCAKALIAEAVKVENAEANAITLVGPDPRGWNARPNALTMAKRLRDIAEAIRGQS